MESTDDQRIPLTYKGLKAMSSGQYDAGRVYQHSYEYWPDVKFHVSLSVLQVHKK